MAKHRSCTDIAADVIKAAIGGATKTRILYAAGLSTNNLTKYVSLLVGSGLLELEPVNRRYSPTEKGATFLQIYEETVTMAEIIEVIKKGES